jgi:hypothetical protein
MSRWIVLRGLTTSAALAWMLGGTAAARGQLHVNLDLGHHPGASIRFGGHEPPRVRPVVPPAAVRYEHYHEREWHGRPIPVVPPPVLAYRHPYRDEYVRRFRPGYRTIVVGSTQYYAYTALPPGCQTVAVNGVTYFLADGVYYQPQIYEGQTVYMVVPPPI